MLADASAPGRIEGPHRARIVVQPAIPVPARARVDASGISQVPRQSILCLCPGPRPRPNRRTLASDGLVDAAPALSTAEASALSYRGYRGASAPAVYASRMMLPPPMQDSLPAGWLAFAGRELNPLDCDERFPSCYILFPSPGFILTLRKRTDKPDSTLPSHLLAKKASDDAQELHRAVWLGDVVLASGSASLLLVPLHRV